MSGNGSEKPGFQIGLAMAGAVSAGAYSAGVFDFLIEALNEWQKAKERGEDVPKHDVFISVMSGTSAGGIVGALGLAALAGGVRATDQPAVNPKQDWPVKRVLPELYDAWVKKTKLFESRGAAKKGGSNQSLLDTTDLDQSKGLPISLLNSDALTNIARDSLRAIHPTGERYAFLSDPTHLFLTRTNLDGVPYPIMFEGTTFWMNLHEDRAHFAVTNLGKRKFPAQECQWLTTWDDAGQPIDFNNCGERGTPGGPLGEVLESYAQAALTTSAFPFGFQAREIPILEADIRRRALPFDAGTYPEMLRKQSQPAPPGAQTSFVCIDGGALNNEPFELARWTIRNLDETQNFRDPKTANRAVILIAPFPPEQPSQPTAKVVEQVLKSRKDDLALLFVARRLIPALVDQARFKSSDLIAAADPKVYSRFLISPSRHKPQPVPPRKIPYPDLACGLLYAFGGFLDEQFREHDFQLGRRNCQKFLQDHFRLHPDNPVFGRSESTGSAEDARLPIIPLVGTAAVEVKQAPWPTIAEETLADLRTALERRLDPLVGRFTSHVLGAALLMRLAVYVYWRRRRHALITRLMKIVEATLDDSQQIERVRRPGFFTRLKGWFGLGRK
jgi:Patatin-like phospholipase